MKKIINGRKYDTETAKEVGFFSNEYPCGDFNWCQETLYKRKQVNISCMEKVELYQIMQKVYGVELPADQRLFL